MTINHTPHTEPEHFEDRLLSSILENFDELTDASTARRPAPHLHTPRPRRRLHLAWTAPVLAAVAGAAVLIAVDPPHANHTPAPTTLRAGTGNHVHATVAMSHGKKVLYRLAAKSLSAPGLSGRYAVLGETDTETDEPGVEVKRTSVDDTLTGASITYQTGYATHPEPPSVLKDGPDADETTAYFAALPLDPVALRAALLTTAKQAWSANTAAIAADAKQNGVPAALAGPASAMPSDDDFVYQQASDMLWSPVVSPALRAALYKVLASCSNVTIDQSATDPSGRPAIEISATDSYLGTLATYEDPATGAVLAQKYTTGTTENDEVYAPVTSSDSIPLDPYGN